MFALQTWAWWGLGILVGWAVLTAVIVVLMAGASLNSMKPELKEKLLEE